MTFLHHEQIYRGKDILDKIKTFPICICGIGAIGSNLVENLVRQGFGNFTVIDKDRIEERNINTQIWTLRDIGALKTNVLKYRAFEIAKININSFAKTLETRNQAKLISPDALIIDAFDNSKSRQLLKDFCLKAGIDCLHIGFSGDYGEIIWNEDYRVPDDKGEDDCDYPLARNLILLLVAVASETIIKYVVSGIKENYTITLKDFNVERYTL